ncbi:MAG TPA: protein kinase [Thermoanaerobaculia bacterium]|nr:protein kinase [Thermoanaerobaculia bacterium]
MSLLAGSRLGPYEIVSLLGAGGMGEVWRARDGRLGREVAVKVLPAHVADDPKALARFEREARAVAALSHPNVLALHDYGREDGLVYTVSELLEGETLRQRLRQGPIPVRKVAEWGAQVARGLAAAHDKGIVHRDLKPENLFLTRDGRVTVLDFGVALYDAPIPTDDTGADTMHVKTEAGRVLGTMGYMAPEQVCGEPVDARSDIFALGCVLYEMLTGERPFHRESVAETVVAVLREEPDGLEAMAGAVQARRVPPAFIRLVRHCLEKRPEERFQSARDLAFQLEVLASEGSGTATGPNLVAEALPAPRRWRAGIPALLAALAVGLLLGGAIGAWLATRRQPAPTRLRVLTHSGNDSWPTASPDGKLVAFASDRDGRPRIWLRQMSSGDEVAVTDGVDAVPRFSPDGTSLLFVRRRESGSDLLRVAAVGGEAKRLVPDAVGGDWSPDGKQIAFVRSLSRTRWVVGVAASDGGEERRLSRENALPLAQLRWSPDGRWVAVLRRSSLAGAADSVLLLDVRAGYSEDNNERVLRLPGVNAISALGWTSDETLVLAVPEGAGARTPSSRLVAYDLRDDDSRTLLWVPYVVPSLDVLAAGQVVFTAVVPRQNLRELPLAASSSVDAQAASDQGHWLSRGTSVDRQPIYAPGGHRVVFSSSRGGSLDLWSMSIADRSVHRLTDDPAEDWDPAFTPDGRHLLWSSNRGGHFEIWMAEADGRAARQLSHDGGDAENPTATADGWVLYGSGTPGKRGIWRMRLDGSGARLLVPGVTNHPETSPDGRYVMYHAPVEDREEIRVARVDDGSAVPFTVAIPFRNLPVSFGLSALPAAPGRARWRPDGQAIVYVGLMPDGRFAVFEQPFAPGRDTFAERRIVALSEGELITESLGVAPDGKRLLISFIERTPNLVVAEGVPDLDAPRRSAK